jgi:hypothetical protein
VRIPMVPPASPRLLAVRFGQISRFALPSLVFVPKCALFAGHIVAGTATDIERKQLDSILAALEK